MPIYEFECRDCRTRFDKLCSFSSADDVDCPECGGHDVRRLISMFYSKSSSDGGSSCSCGGNCGGSCGGDCGGCGGSCSCH